MIAIASRSFSADPELRRRLNEAFPNHRLNVEGARLSGATLEAFFEGANGVVVGVEPIDSVLLDRLPDLRVISKYGVGLDSIDVDAVSRRGIVLATASGTNAQAVAEMSLLLILGVLRRVPEALVNVQDKRWTGLTGHQLEGKTIGLVGVGHVGRRLAQLLKAFNCQILGFDTRSVEIDGVRQVSLPELLEAADVVSLHLPLNEATRGIIGPAELARMKPTAVLVNTARGLLVDEGALELALLEGRIAGAGLDVLSEEPPKQLRLAEIPSVFLTPHLAGSTSESNLAMGLAALEGLVANRSRLLG